LRTSQRMYGGRVAISFWRFRFDDTTLLCSARR
jgi:hypothetical protein